MNLLLTFAFVLMFVAAAVSKKYEGEDGKLMPTSTPEGKKARLILAPILAIGVTALILNYAEGQSYMHSRAWIIVCVITIVAPIISYIKFKSDQKKK